MYAGANPAGLIDDGHEFMGIDCPLGKNDRGGCNGASPARKVAKEIGAVTSLAGEGFVDLPDTLVEYGVKPGIEAAESFGKWTTTDGLNAVSVSSDFVASAATAGTAFCALKCEPQLTGVLVSVSRTSFAVGVSADVLSATLNCPGGGGFICDRALGNLGFSAAARGTDITIRAVAGAAMKKAGVPRPVREVVLNAASAFINTSATIKGNTERQSD
jgi:hypothetical protein